MKLSKKYSSRNGMAMMIVMAVVALLSATAVTLHKTSLADWKMARSELDRIRFNAAAYSGITLALEILQKDQRPYFWFPHDGVLPVAEDGTNRGISDLEEALMRLGRSSELPIDIDGVPVEISITDEAALININRTAGIEFRRLLQSLSKIVPYEDPDDPNKSENEYLEELVSALEDWRDPDSNTRPKGAEENFYKKSKPFPYRPRNGPILSLGCLLYTSPSPRD